LRDDFNAKVKDILAKRVAYRCSNPSCRALTSGPGADPNRALNIGVAAHITAAAPGGPRFDVRQTKEQRSSITNAIWLCQNCAKLIDSDATTYSREVLLRWKWQEEDAARKTLGFTNQERQPSQDSQIQLVIQSCIQRGVIIVIGRAVELALDHSLLQNLDDIVESTLRAGMQGGVKRSSLPYRRAVPDLAAILNGTVTEEEYYTIRERLYRTIDQSGELRELARRYVESYPFTILTNITHQITSLIAAGIVKGVVQLNPLEAIERHIALSSRCDPKYYRNGDVVSDEPFVLNLGLDALDLPVLHLKNSDIASALGPYLKQCTRPRPVIVAINMSPIDSRLLSLLASSSEAQTDFFIVGGQLGPLGAQAALLSINPLKLVSELDAAVTPRAQLFRFCRTIEFRGTPSITRIVNSEKLQPDDVKIAMVPYEFEEDLRILKETRRVPIADHAGTGKSTRAFLLCYEMFKHGHPIFFLPLSELYGNQVNLPSLVELVNDLATLNPEAVLLIDDMHLFPKLDEHVSKWLDGTKGVRRPYIIFVSTHDYAFQDLIGGQIAPLEEKGGKPEKAKAWRENRRQLSLWVQRKSQMLTEARILITPEILERCENSQNPWHFFYLLRGGYEGLVTSVSSARARNRADIVWFCLALQYAISKERPYVTWEVLDTVQKHNLLPPHIPNPLAHIWVSESVQILLSSHLIVSEGEGMAPRHKLEAAMLVRSMLAVDHGMRESCRAAFIDILSEVIPRISLPQSSFDELIHGDKFGVKQVVWNHIRPTVDAVVKYQITLVRFPQLRDFFSEVWEEFIKAIVSADLHHLYWIVNAIPEFTMHTFAYSPFEYCTVLNKVNSLHTVSDAIDLSIFLKSVVGEDGIRRAEFEYLKLLNSYRLLGVQKMISYQLKNDPHLSKKDRRFLRRTAGEITDFINSKSGIEAQDGAKILSRLPDVPTEADMERLAVEETAALLQAIEDRRIVVAKVADLIDSNSVAKFMRGRHTSVGFLILASLWLMSPEAAGRLYNSFSSRQLRELERRLIDYDSYSEFHLSRDSLVFHLFVRWLGTKNKRIAKYYDESCADEATAEFRKRVEQANQDLRLKEHDSTDAESRFLGQIDEPASG
jgi:hypothetical protein